MLHPLAFKVNIKNLFCYPQVFRRCKATGSMLDTVDASSMLYRLEMEGKTLKRLMWEFTRCNLH